MKTINIFLTVIKFALLATAVWCFYMAIVVSVKTL